STLESRSPVKSAQDTKVPISKELKVTTGTKYALQCGDLMQAWHEWRHLMAVHHTWLNLKNPWTAAFNEQCNISCLTGSTLMTQAMQLWMMYSVTGHCKKQLTNTITKLQDNAKLLHIIHQFASHTPCTKQHHQPHSSGTPTAIVTPMTTKSLRHNSKTCKSKMPGRQDNATHQNMIGAGTSRETTNHKIINSVYFTPGCTNPSNLNTTALLDTAANIFLLTPNAPALQDATTLPVKTIMQPSWDTLRIAGNATFLLSKLPQSAKQAYCIASLTDNLLSVAILASATCEVFFHQTGCKVIFSGEIILQGWCDLTTRLWRVPLHNDEGKIVPHDACIVESTEPTPLTCNIYECENTNQLIDFYYATMGYPLVYTWCKTIDKGHFQCWNSRTSKRVRHFVKPSGQNLMGHLDQRQQGIRSIKSATSVDVAPDPMEEPQQCP
ncbi:hypothetical protein ACHAW6_003712, partial [Cyclotella cf. meneghiniana]